MRIRTLLLLAIAWVAWPLSAAAQTAFTTQAVNVRAGPDRSFPLVTWLNPGVGVTVIGCLDNWSWCDVVVGPQRGWIYARFLSFPFQGSPTPIIVGGPVLGLPIVTFSVGTYWGLHYAGRPWVHNQRYWDNRWHRRPPPPAWRPPPSRPPSSGRPPNTGRPPNAGRPPSTGRPPNTGRPPSTGRPPQGNRPSGPGGGSSGSRPTTRPSSS